VLHGRLRARGLGAAARRALVGVQGEAQHRILADQMPLVKLRRERLGRTDEGAARHARRLLGCRRSTSGKGSLAKTDVATALRSGALTTAAALRLERVDDAVRAVPRCTRRPIDSRTEKLRSQRLGAGECIV